MNKIKITLLVIYVICSISAYSQDPFQEMILQAKEKYTPPMLTKEQMYADFDYFVELMQNCNPQYPVVKMITGYDMVQQVMKLRDKIEDVQSIFDFMRIMQTAMYHSLDGHSGIGVQIWWHRYGFYREEVEIAGITDQDFGYMFHYRDSVFWNIAPFLDLCYTNGEYGLKYETVFYTKEDSITIPAGSRITSYNGQHINQYIHDSIRTRFSRWDNDRKQFYHLKLEPMSRWNEIEFQIENQPVRVYFKSFRKEEREFNMMKFHKIYTHFFQRDSILYFRLPLMGYDTSQLNKILSYKDEPFKAIMIDIRENYGGGDKCWEYLLSLIGGEPIRFHSSLLIPDHPEAIKRYPGYEKRRTWEMLSVEKPFIVIDDEQAEIEIHPDNLAYNGTIYILVDEEVFSSASSFASLGKHNDRIKTIGMSTGVYSGRGSTPNGFILPHSRLPFIVSISLDDSYIEKPYDFFHNEVNFPFSPSLNYYQYYHSPQRAYEPDEKAMYEHDELFLHALEIINKKK